MALPCLAFGTPVRITRPPATGFPERFSLLEEMGVPYGELAVRDVSAQADRYRRFLARHLGIAIEPGEPKPPVPVTPDRIPLATRGRFAFEDLRNGLRDRWRGDGPRPSAGGERR